MSNWVEQWEDYSDDPLPSPVAVWVVYDQFATDTILLTDKGDIWRIRAISLLCQLVNAPDSVIISYEKGAAPPNPATIRAVNAAKFTTLCDHHTVGLRRKSEDILSFLRDLLATQSN